MNPARIRILRQKLSSLADELARLETKRDELVERRVSATTPPERLKCAA